jgi:hypothetical protein
MGLSSLLLCHSRRAATSCLLPSPLCRIRHLHLLSRYCAPLVQLVILLPTTATTTALVVRCCCVGTATMVPTRGIAITRRGYDVAGARSFGQYSAIHFDNASRPPRCPPPCCICRVCHPQDCKQRAVAPLMGCSPARGYCRCSLALDWARHCCRCCGPWQSSLRCCRRCRRCRRHCRCCHRCCCRPCCCCCRMNQHPATMTRWTGLLSF